MRAVVIERPHEAAYRELEMPVCGPDDVLVRSRKAGVCRTDVDVLTGMLDRRWVRYPCVPGHEWVGSVAEVGRSVDDLVPGNLVVCEGIIPCHRCRAGDTNLCENYDQLGFTRPGGYAEYVLVPRRVVHCLPGGVSLDAAVLVEPASVVLTGLERSRSTPGNTVGVIGVGTLGSLALVLARLFAPAAIVAYGVRREELELARRLGADHTIDATGDAEKETRKLLGGGLDLVVETAGAVHAVELATRLLREGGRAVLLGIAGEGRTLELPADRVPLRALELIGSVGYTSGVWTRVLDLLAHGLVRFDEIVTHRFAVAEFEAAFDLIENRRGIVGKIVLEHGERE